MNADELLNQTISLNSLFQHVNNGWGLLILAAVVWGVGGALFRNFLTVRAVKRGESIEQNDKNVSLRDMIGIARFTFPVSLVVWAIGAFITGQGSKIDAVASKHRKS